MCVAAAAMDEPNWREIGEMFVLRKFVVLALPSETKSEIIVKGEFGVVKWKEVEHGGRLGTRVCGLVIEGLDF